MKRPRQPSEMFDALERRTVLNAARPTALAIAPPASIVHAEDAGSKASLPYSTLSIHGKFRVGVPTTVTFVAGKQAITVVPKSMTSSTIVVSVPGFFNARTGQPTATGADVFVAQKLGARTRSVRAVHDLHIASLPTTGLPPGTLVASVAAEARVLIADAIAGLSGPTPPGVADVAGARQGLQALDQGIVGVETAVAGGSATSVNVGTYRGKAAVIDGATLALADRVIASVVDNPSGLTPHATPLKGTALTDGLAGLVQGAIAQGPSAVLRLSSRFFDILDTIPGTKGLPPGALLTGLTLGDSLAIIGVAEAEAGLASRGAAPLDPAQVDQFLANPAFARGDDAISQSFVPAIPTGLPIVEAAMIDRALAVALLARPKVGLAPPIVLAAPF